MKLSNLLTLTDKFTYIHLYEDESVHEKAVAKCPDFFTDIELMKFMEHEVTHICPCDDYLAVEIAVKIAE